MHSSARRRMVRSLIIFSLAVGLVSVRADEADQIAGKIAPSMVRIAGFVNRDDPTPSVDASGFFVDPAGLVLSVASAFTDRENRLLCERFELRLFDGRRLEATLHAADALLNLLLLSVATPGPYPAAEMSPGMAQPGETLIAVAGPVTRGRLQSAAGRVKAPEQRSLYGLGLGDLYINLDLKPPPGADGGPLLSASGKLVGINSPNIHRPGGVTGTAGEAHALPMRTARSFVKIAKGRPLTEDIWIGLAFRPPSHDETAQAAKLLGRRAGIFVDFVWDKGPAGQSGILAGDLLVSLNGVDLVSPQQLEQRLEILGSGRTAELALLRDGRIVFRQVRAEKRPAWAAPVYWRTD